MPLPTLYLFADEAGNLDFSNAGSEYFIVCAVTMRTLQPGHQLMDLRHDLTMMGTDVEAFHAQTDPWPIRNHVYALLPGLQVEVDAIALHKRKTYPWVAANEFYFYKLAWHLLFKYMAPLRCQPNDYLLVAAGSLGTKKRRARFAQAVSSVIGQHNVCQSHCTASWEASTHPGLQIADYCTWAIQRWIEHGYLAPYNLVRPLVKSYFSPFSGNPNTYY